MSDKEKLHFKLGLSRSNTNKDIHFNLYLNSTLQVDSYLNSEANTTQYFEFDAEIAEGDHELKVVFLNKESSDTIQDDNGIIVSDLLLNIDEIEIDEIELATLKWSESVYTPDYPLDYLDETQKQITSVDNCVNLGWNGTWKLKFQSPFYLWLLEKF